MNDYYREQRLIGETFERYVLERLVDEWGMRLTRSETGADQLKFGDTHILEIKYDRELVRTGNVCIEVAEKTDAKNARFVPSGIYGDASAFLFGIGNEKEFFIFSKRTLRKLWTAITKGGFLDSNGKGIRSYETATSQGFLINRCVLSTWTEQAVILGGEPGEIVSTVQRHAADAEPDPVDMMREIGKAVFGIQYDARGVAIE